MNIKEFRNTIKCDELAQVNDSETFLYKSYLNILLRGGKLWQECLIYAAGKHTPAFNLPEDMPLPEDEKTRCVNALIETFTDIVETGRWIEIYTTAKYYDENGNEIVDEEGEHYEEDMEIQQEELENKTISKRVETTTKTTYFLNDPVEVKPLCEKETKKQRARRRWRTYTKNGVVDLWITRMPTALLVISATRQRGG
jgi:hypothetical protein